MQKLKIVAAYAAMGALLFCSLDGFMDHRSLYWLWLIGAVFHIPIIVMIEASSAFKAKLAIPGLFIGAGVPIEVYAIFLRDSGFMLEPVIAVGVVITAASIIAVMIKEGKTRPQQPVPSPPHS